MEDLTMPERDHRDEAAYSAWQESLAEHYMEQEAMLYPDKPMSLPDDEPPFDPLHDEPSADEADPSVPIPRRIIVGHGVVASDIDTTDWLWGIGGGVMKPRPEVTIFVSGQDIIDRAKPDSLVTFTDITHFRSLAVLIARDRIKNDEGWTPDPEPLVVEDCHVVGAVTRLTGVEVTFAVMM